MRCWIIQVFFATPRRTLWWIAIALTGMLVFGLYLQNAVGLRPCPMCIVQRYALILVAVFAGLASARGSKGWWMSFAALALLAAFGPARAEDAPPPPESSVTVGTSLLSGNDADRALFGWTPEEAIETIRADAE